MQAVQARCTQFETTDMTLCHISDESVRILGHAAPMLEAVRIHGALLQLQSSVKTTGVTLLLCCLLQQDIQMVLVQLVHQHVFFSTCQLLYPKAVLHLPQTGWGHPHLAAWYLDVTTS